MIFAILAVACLAVAGLCWVFYSVGCILWHTKARTEHKARRATVKTTWGDE